MRQICETPPLRLRAEHTGDRRPLRAPEWATDVLRAASPASITPADWGVLADDEAAALSWERSEDGTHWLPVSYDASTSLVVAPELAGVWLRGCSRVHDVRGRTRARITTRPQMVTPACLAPPDIGHSGRVLGATPARWRGAHDEHTLLLSGPTRQGPWRPAAGPEPGMYVIACSWARNAGGGARSWSQPLGPLYARPTLARSIREGLFAH